MSLMRRALAVGIIILACVSLCTSEKKPRVLVLALDGVSASRVDELSEEGMLPNLSVLLGHGTRQDLFGGSRQDPREFWQAVFSMAETPTAGGPTVWDTAAAYGARSVVVDVPDTQARVSATQIVLPGANEALGFIGDNIGRFLDSSTDVGTLGWPYADAPPEASRSIRALSPGTASPWIAVSFSGQTERKGMFRAYRLVDGALYVSPIYRSIHSARTYVAEAPEALFYVADDPGWTTDSSRLTDFFFEHQTDLAEARAEVAALLGATAPAMLVYFDASVALVSGACAMKNGAEAENLVREAYRAVDARLGTLVSSLQQPASLVIVAREPGGIVSATENERVPTGFVVTNDGRGLARGADMSSPSDVSGLILGMLRLPVQPKAEGREAPTFHEQSLPLTSGSLANLGLLSASSKVVFDTTDGGVTVRKSAPR